MYNCDGNNNMAKSITMATTITMTMIMLMMIKSLIVK